MRKVNVKTPSSVTNAKIVSEKELYDYKRKTENEEAKVDDEQIHDIVENSADKILGEELERYKIEQKEKINLFDRERPLFYEEFSIENIGEPVQLSLRKINEKILSLSQLEKEKESSRNEGYAAGEKDATEKFKKELLQHQQWVKQFDSTIKNLKESYRQEIENLEKTIPKVASTVAEKIIQRETSEDSEIVIEQVKKAIRSLNDDKIFKIYLNPEDVDILKEVKSELAPSSLGVKQAELIADDSISKGGCKLDTSAGQIDATIKSQLENIKDKLDEKFENIDDEDNLADENKNNSEDESL